MYDIKKRFLSGDQIPVQGGILDGFGEMRGLDILCAFEVGDRAGDFKDTGIGPGAQAKFIDGQFQKLLTRLVDLAKLLDMAVGHLGVAVRSSFV